MFGGLNLGNIGGELSKLATPDVVDKLAEGISQLAAGGGSGGRDGPQGGQQQQQQAPQAGSLPVWSQPTPATDGNRRTRALFIGINYTGTSAALRGCIQDVKNISAYVESTGIFKERLILTDDQQDASLRPTRANIENGFRWLVAGVQAGDALFLHYSGHGAYQQDTDGDEKDGKDETICPLDYEQAGQITDDQMHELLVKPLVKGVRLTAVFDCCHSGSGIDLPFTYSVDGNLEITMRDNRKQAIKHGLQAGLALFKNDHGAAAREAFQAISLFAQPQAPGSSEEEAAAHKKSVEEKTSEAEILFFSGCKDEQTSADAVIEGEATGAMSWGLLAVLREVQQPNLADLLRRLREKLHGKYQQIPQMSTGHQIDVTRSSFFLG
ncbi:caspase domain-containing protein [Entophlyctis helioformis]|nr:caspase domain-containing protein [Entophlyctis helioformis]